MSYNNTRTIQRVHKKKHYRRRKFRAMIVVLSVVAVTIIALSLKILINTFVMWQPIHGNALINTDITADSVDLSHLNSKNAVLIDRNSGEIVSANNSQERIFPASMTKMMTVIVALENTSDISQMVLIPEDFYDELYVQDASMAGFLPGEEVSYRDLIYGAMLSSGAECCLALAKNLAGSETAFVELMNEKCNELGLADTHFTNVTGLHDENHYSTVEDMAVITEYGLKNEIFATAFTAKSYSTPSTNMHPEGMTFCSTLFDNMDFQIVESGRILGGKTGYTGEAGQCLSSLARIGDNEYILVTAQAGGHGEDRPLHIEDALNVYSQLEK